MPALRAKLVHGVEIVGKTRLCYTACNRSSHTHAIRETDMTKILNILFGKPGKGMSDKDREISESIRKLKSLDVVEGRVSIAPSEVVTEDFINERKKARRLLSA